MVDSLVIDKNTNVIKFNAVSRVKMYGAYKVKCHQKRRKKQKTSSGLWRSVKEKVII